MKQFENLMDLIDIDEIGTKGKIKSEVERFNKFQQVLSGKKKGVQAQEIDIRNYAGYLLRGGKDIEKRELLGCLRSKIIFRSRKYF